MSEYSGLSQWDDSMRLALDQARMASMHGDVPVGAVILDQTGRVLAAAGNERENLTNANDDGYANDPRAIAVAG